MHEEVNGLRVLGSPIGSLSFQRQFITDYLSQAKQDAIKLLAGLDDEQTILPLHMSLTSMKEKIHSINSRGSIATCSILLLGYKKKNYFRA